MTLASRMTRIIDLHKKNRLSLDWFIPFLSTITSILHHPWDVLIRNDAQRHLLSFPSSSKTRLWGFLSTEYTRIKCKTTITHRKWSVLFNVRHACRMHKTWIREGRNRINEVDRVVAYVEDRPEKRQHHHCSEEVVVVHKVSQQSMDTEVLVQDKVVLVLDTRA